VGHVQVTVALEQHSARLSEDRAQVVKAAVQDSLAFFELVFGPYPLDFMTVVNVPRSYSQALPGFVTLGSEVINYEQGIAIYQPFWRKAHDPRAVVAHEVSHQWWGSLVDGKTYRDHWFNEALANYSALLYGRARLGWKNSDSGTLIENWRFELAEPSSLDGRPLEAAGPLNVGGRLDSSHGDLHDLITYKKGGVVVETLARAIEPRKLYDVLRSLAERYHGQEISTAELLDFIAAEAKTDLGWFARRFVYGTGWPEIDYRYAVEPRAQRGWTVTVQAHQRTPYRFRYRLAAKPGGTVDVVRDLVPLFDVSRSTVSVPVQIAFPAPERAGRSRGKEEEPPVVEGRILVRGRDSEFSLELDSKPSDVWLDRDGVVYARLYKEGQHPKEQLLQLAYEAAAAGRTDEAIARLRKASTQELLSDEESEDVARRAERWGTRYVEAWVQVELARLYLDQGQTEEARAALKAADRAVPEFYRNLDNFSSPLLYPYRRWLTEQLALVESRLDLQTGRPEKAFARLRDPLLSDDAALDHTEAYVLLAVAARATGHKKDYEEALTEIRARGVETGPLQEERAAAKQ
ncbi:MAG TPA: M1 family aminopeptidase, partial [Thermoanaerobaculia bacterium]|nr:M1 family aminopeptidase [Thermoanaerobaculia bacterium]